MLGTDRLVALSLDESLGKGEIKSCNAKISIGVSGGQFYFQPAGS